MTPSSAVHSTGNGANMALRDGLELAQQQINPASATLADAVAAYDADSMPRSTGALKMGRRIIDSCHNQGWQYVRTVAFLWTFGVVVNILGCWLWLLHFGRRLWT